MRVTVLAVALVVSVAQLCCANAQNTTYYQTGNAINENCNSNGAADNLFIYGYVEGVIDARQYIADGYCIPSPVQARQLRDVVCMYIQNNPQNRQIPAGYLVIEALKQAWPCQ